MADIQATAAAPTLNPHTPSSDYNLSIYFWRMVKAILIGAEALRGDRHVHNHQHNFAGPPTPVANLSQLPPLRHEGGWLGVPYLPKFPKESLHNYELRRRHAPLTNIYADISRNLAGKPFSKTLQLDEKTSPDLVKLADNIDGQGNNLHVFARELFKNALDKGIGWVLIDYMTVPPAATLADERSMNARPYWVQIEPERLIAVYSAFIAGTEIIYNARISENVMELQGYSEIYVQRIREFKRDPIVDAIGNVIAYGPATWTLWELIEAQDQGGKKSTDWTIKQTGPVTIGIIPLVPFIPGKREGMTWRVDAPLKDIAYLQIEEFQQESNLKTIKEKTAFPMLAGNGVHNLDQNGIPITDIDTGPNTILMAPPNASGSSGSWSIIEPSGSSLNFLETSLDNLRKQMRDLGMQPMTDANLTVITTANVSLKAHSAVQAWALGLKDALEGAWIVTCKWLNRTDFPQVNVHTDFGVDFEAGSELDSLLRCEAQGILSKKTIWDEFKRRGVLSDDFDPKLEEKQLAKETQGLIPEVAIDPVTGEVVQPTTRPHTITQAPMLPAPPAPTKVNAP